MGLNVAVANRSLRANRNHIAGIAAETCVERHYDERGLRCMDRRWRGRGGEIDLVFEDSGSVVFVEVKASSTHSRARNRVARAQMQRIMRCGSEYVAQLPKGQLTPVRFDVATVNAIGEVELVENAFFQM